MSGLVLEFQSRGLVASGNTFAVRETLKSLGGRWDAQLKVWTFPFEVKKALLKGLKHLPSSESLTIDDRAKVKLSLAVPADTELGFLVSGETFPVKELLKELGGTWNSKLKSWSFRSELKQLLRDLRSSSDISEVEVQNQETCRDLVPERKSPSKKLSLCQVPESNKLRRLNTKSKIDSLDIVSTKVVETATRQTRAERQSNGSSAVSHVEKRQKKVSCAKTGAHLQTEAVTKKCKVVHTKDKIVETRTIVVKRVRNK